MNKDTLLAIIREEGDHEEFNHAGHGCIIRRACSVAEIEKSPRIDEYNGIYWCGYVQIPKTHPLCKEDVTSLECHGGVTFRGARFLPKDPKWYIGFDCAHLGDRSSLKEMGFGELYCNKAYVINETKRLAEQIVDYLVEESVR